MLKDELQVVTATVGVDATVGSLVPQNMVRFIYRVKFQNLNAGLNTLTLGSRENGALATTTIDTLTAVVLGEQIVDPEELNEESVPLYKVYGRTGNVAAAANSAVRAAASAGVASGTFTYWYVDRES